MNIIVIGAIIVIIAIGVPTIMWITLWLATLADKPQDGKRVYSPTLVKARGKRQ